MLDWARCHDGKRSKVQSRSITVTVHVQCANAVHTKAAPRTCRRWSVCRLTYTSRAAVSFRRYRGHRAGRPRRSVHRLRPTGNGAFVVTAPRIKRRSISCPRPRSLLDVRRSSSSGTSCRRLAFGFLNIRSLANKVDDLLEVRRDRAVDVLCLAETWYDADSVCVRRLHSGGYRVVDRPRPHPSSES